MILRKVVDWGAPMPSAENSALLVERMLQSEAAIAEAYSQYFEGVLELFRRRLTANIRRRADSNDLAQSAWISFVKYVRKDRQLLDGRKNLWPLIAHIALCKYADALEKARSAKRDITRETSLETILSKNPGIAEFAHGPSVSEEVVAADLIEALSARLGDDRQRRILGLQLEGYTVEEIADDVQLSQSTIKRVLKKVRDLHLEVTGNGHS
jgi:RNA polymerase sigma factor (sigma-70 family)